MKHKTFSVDVKAGAEDSGTFEATVAVFGNVDHAGDRILPGAFTDTLNHWKASGDPIPVILSHQWDNPMAHIGVVEDARQTPGGLWVKGRLDVDDNDVARQVHRLMRRRSLREFSFGYTVPKGGEKRRNGANELEKIDLIEVGPTLKGANPQTELHAVKSALDGTSPTVALFEALSDEIAQQVAELPTDVKGRLAAKAQQILDSSKADETDRQTRSVDPLLDTARQAVTDIRLDGVPAVKSPPPPPEPVAVPSDENLRTEFQRQMSELLRS